MLYAKILNTDGDTVEVFDSVEAAEMELSFYDDSHSVEVIGVVEYDEFLEENGFF